MLREYKEADHEIVTVLIAEFFNHHRELHGNEQPMSKAEAEQICADWAGKSILLVYEDSGTVVGFVRLRRDGSTHWIEDIGVSSASRGRGHGGRILEEVEHYLIKQGQDSGYVFVVPSNRAAIDFYVSNGYTTLNMIELRKDFKSVRERSAICSSGNGYSLTWKAEREGE